MPADVFSGAPTTMVIACWLLNSCNSFTHASVNSKANEVARVGSYPVKDSSGKTIASAPCATARKMKCVCATRLAGIWPVAGFVCASASFTDTAIAPHLSQSLPPCPSCARRCYYRTSPRNLLPASNTNPHNLL